MERDEQRLDDLMAAYRRACPDPEPSANFMPGLWRKIEAKQRFAWTLRKLTEAIVTATAALCIIMYVYTAHVVESTDYPVDYVDVLESPERFDTLAYADLVSFER